MSPSTEPGSPNATNGDLNARVHRARTLDVVDEALERLLVEQSGRESKQQDALEATRQSLSRARRIIDANNKE